MANRSHDEKHEQPAADGKLPWVHPTIKTFPARDAEVFANPYGGVDAGIYHS